MTSTIDVGRLPGVRVMTFTLRHQGVGAVTDDTRELLRAVTDWHVEHPDDVLLRIEFDNWDNNNEIIRKVEKAGGSRVLALFDLDPRQRSGELPITTWTTQATVTYEVTVPKPVLYDWQEEGWL